MIGLSDRAATRTVSVIAAASALVVSAVFVVRSALTIDGHRWFTLFDDAMISMRYARNLANGHGLVWNPGEAPVS